MGSRADGADPIFVSPLEQQEAAVRRSTKAGGTTIDAGTAAEPATRGRPNGPGLRSLARAHAAAAVDALAAVMRDPSATPAARVSAAGALLAWGYGKAGAEDGERRQRRPEQVVRLIWGGDGD